MLGQLRKLGKQTAIYSFGNILNKFLGFILIPLYNNFIPIGDFGILAVMEITIIFLTSILHFGITAGHQRYFFIEKGKGNYGTFLFNNYSGNVIFTLAAIIPLIFLSSRISILFFNGMHQSGNVQIMLWIAVAEILCALPFQILQFEEKPVRYILLSVFKLVLSFILTVYFVKGLSMGITGILYARLIGGGTAALVSLFSIVLPRLKFRIDLSLLWISVKFGFPAIAGNIGYLIFQMNDRYMLNWMSTEIETGKYSFGFKIANFINLIFITTVGMSFLPSVFSREMEENNTRYYRKMLTYYCFIIAFVILAFLFFYKDILILMIKNKDYWDGLSVVPVLSLSFLIMGMNYFVGIGLLLKNRMHLLVIPSVSAVVLNICLNLYFIPAWGMMGAAFSTLISQIIYTAILAIISERQLVVGFEWGKILLIYFLALLLFGGSLLTNNLSFITASIIRMCLLTVFPLILYKLNFFEKIELMTLREEMVKFFSRNNNSL